MSSSNDKPARNRVADLWDEVLAGWAPGRDHLDRSPLRAWFEGYQGKGPGAVDLSHYPDPYVGDLRGLRSEPRLVLLGLNPGIGYDTLQGVDGTWTRRIRRTGYSHCAQRSPAEDPDSWIELHGKRSVYWRNIVFFARRWLADDGAGVGDVLNLELYPWHSAKLTAPIRPPIEVVKQLVWDPIAEVDVTQVFAFGKDWFEVADSMSLPRIAEYGNGHAFPSGETYSGWRLGVFELPSSQHLVVSSQPGFAGPPGPVKLAVMRELTAAAYQLANGPGSQHNPDVGIPGEVVEGLEAYGVRTPIRRALARLGQQRSITASPPTSGYVGVRPVVTGPIAAYVHTEYVDLALPPDRAKALATTRGWRVLSTNSRTALVQVRLDDLKTPADHELLFDVLVEAIDKSEAGPAFKAAGNATTGTHTSDAILCPVHGTQMLGGSCDQCD